MYYLYILANDLMTHAPLYMKGMRSGKDFIKKKNIKDKYWTYARETDGIWEKSEGKLIYMWLYMNYHTKYMKYKKKYIDLKSINESGLIKIIK